MAAYDKISATYFTLIRLPFRTRFGLCYLLLLPAAILLERNAVIFTNKITQQLHNKQPSQNVLTAGDLAAYNKIFAACFTLVRLLVWTRFGLYFLLPKPACLLLKSILTRLKKIVREKNGHNKPTYSKIRNMKHETLQTKTQFKPCRVWFSIKLVKIANLDFYCSLKMGRQPVIWPPTMKYLPLTSRFSDCFSGRGQASAAYNYYSQLAYYSKTF